MKRSAPATFLTREQADAIEARAAAVEARTGAQVVAAIVGRSDGYAEMPWKAFALGAVLAALALVAADREHPGWLSAHGAALVILGVGAVTAAAATLVPGLGGLFLNRARRDAAVRVHAESLFLRHGLFATRAHNGVLLLVSRFERKVEIVADVGLREHVGEPEWQSVIARIVPLLGASRFADALLEGLAGIEQLLIAHGFQGPPAGGNELPDRPLDEAGGR